LRLDHHADLARRIIAVVFGQQQPVMGIEQVLLDPDTEAITRCQRELGIGVALLG